MRAYIHDTRFCQWRYDLTSQQVHRLLTLSYACIVTELLKLDHLSSRGIAELWRLYKGGCNRQGKIKKCEQELCTKLQQRAEDYQQKLQEQQKSIKQEQEKQRNKRFIQEQHEQVSQELAWLDVSDELYELRDMALEQSKTEGYQQYKQSYDLDAQVQGYLQSKQINYRDYTKCFGTPLQQQYHQEMCDVIKELAEQELHNKHKLHLFDHSLNFVQATEQANNKTYLSVAGVLSWTSRQLLNFGKDIYNRPFEYGQAITSGLYESGKDAIHMLSRPDLALYGLGQMIYFVLETSAMAEAVAAYPCQETQEVYQQRVSQIDSTLSALQQEFIDLDGPGKLKAMTKFGADFYIPVKITHACGYLLSGLCSRSQGVRTLEGAAAMMADEFGVVEAFEELAAKAEQLEPAIEQGVVKQTTAEFMQAENKLSSMGIILRPLKVIIDEVKQFKNGVIPFHRVDLKKELEVALKLIQKRLENCSLKELRKLYSRKIILENGKKYDVNLLIDHVLNFEFSMPKRNIIGGFELQLSGGHAAGIWSLLEIEGLVSIEKVEQLSNGCIKYSIKETFSNKTYTKTEFPLTWSYEKILQNAWEVFEKGRDISASQGKQAKALTINNVEMSIILKRHNDFCSNIITILPYIEKVDK